MPQRIQLRRTKGWRKPEGAIVVSRPSKWGNPYRVEAPEIVTHPDGRHWWVDDAALFAVAMFKADLCESRLVIQPLSVRAGLRGHDLACWCPLDQPCHADVLLELANQ